MGENQSPEPISVLNPPVYNWRNLPGLYASGVVTGLNLPRSLQLGKMFLLNITSFSYLLFFLCFCRSEMLGFS